MRSSSFSWPELAELREFNRGLTAHPRVALCGNKFPRGVVGASDEILHTRRYCQNVWLCPTCAARRACGWRQRLQRHLGAWASTGGAVAMLTLTMTHSCDDALNDLMQRLDAGWSALQRGSGWQADRHHFGIRDYVRVAEVVHNAGSAWNPHFHTLLLRDPAPSNRNWDELHDRLATRFARGVRAAGGSAELVGQDLKVADPGGEPGLAWYCTKGAWPFWSQGSRTPAAILADLRRTGEGIDLVEEFDTTFISGKHRRYNSSHGLESVCSAA